MRNRGKRPARRGPGLGRGGRILVDLALVAAMAAGVWFFYLKGAPFTREGALRQLERTMLLPPGETLYREEPDYTQGLELAFVLGEGYAYIGSTRAEGYLPIGWQAEMEQIVLADQQMPLMPVEETQRGYSGQEGRRQQAAFLCPWGPEGAVRGELDLVSRCSWRTYEWNGRIEGETVSRETSVERYHGQAQRDDYGVYSFILQAEDGDGAIALCQLLGGLGYERPEKGLERACTIQSAEYELRFYREDGSLVHTTRGELDPDVWHLGGQASRPTQYGRSS